MLEAEISMVVFDSLDAFCGVYGPPSPQNKANVALTL